MSRGFYKGASGNYAMPHAPEGGTGDLPMPSDAASVRSGGGGEAVPARYHRSSGEVHRLADEISNMEQRFAWLQHRNGILTQGLFSAQKSFATMIGGASGKQLKQSHFIAWKNIMSELRLQRQLEEQTRSLDQCQQVARELGAALSEEQSLRQSHSDDCDSVKEDVMRAHARNDGIRHNIDRQQAHIDALKARLQTAEMYIARSREYAVVLVEEGNNYEKKKMDIERQQTDTREPTRAHTRQYTMEESTRLRAEAQSVVQKAHSLLPASSPERNSPASPQQIYRQRGPISTGASAPAPVPLSRGIENHSAWAEAPAPTLKAKDRFAAWQSEEANAPGSPQTAMFDAIDVNHDGVIDREEYEQYMASKGNRDDPGSPSLAGRFIPPPLSSQVMVPNTAPASYMQVMPPTAGTPVAMPPIAIQAGTASPMVAAPIGSASPMVPGGNASFMMPRTPILASRQPTQVVVGGMPYGYQQPTQGPYTMTPLLARQ